MQRNQLQKLTREELIREAERAGVPRPRVLTHAELVDEILKRTAASDRDRTRARGWLGRARDLIATVVEKGLHLPDAAAAIRGTSGGWPPPPPPLPTVTLAEIYAAQGHLERAVAVLDDVLARDPEHQEARELRERFLSQLGRGPQGAEGEAPAQSAKKSAPPAPPVSAPPTLDVSPQPAAPAAEPAASADAGEESAPREASIDESDHESEESPIPGADLGPAPSVAQVTTRSPSVELRLQYEALASRREQEDGAGAAPAGESAAPDAAAAEPVGGAASAEAPAEGGEPAAVDEAALIEETLSESGALFGVGDTQVPADGRPSENLEAPPAAEAPGVTASPEGLPAAQDEAAAAQDEAAAARDEAAAAQDEAAAAQDEAAAAQDEAAAAQDEAAAAAQKPASMAAPAHDVDEVVALAVDPSTFYVYWEVRATTFAHLLAGAPGGALTLRVIAVTPGWDGPIVETRDIAVDALHGDRFIHHVRPRADVRVSVGWLHDGRFDPIAVGAEISAPRAFVAAGAPGPEGAPLDLSEGLHGPLARFAAPAHELALRGLRGAERLAAGYVPRDLQGVSIEGAPGQDQGPVGWLWVPAAGDGLGDMHVSFGPVPAGAATGSRPAAWGGSSDVTSWGGASHVTAWSRAG